MRSFISVLIIFFGVILQVTLLPKWTVWGVIPNLVLLLVICQSALRGYSDGLIWAISGGLALDFFSKSYFGTFSVIFLFLAFIISFAVKNVLSKVSLFSIMIITAVSTIFFDVVFLTTLKINALSLEIIFNFIRFIIPEYFIQIIFKEIVYNLILMIFIYFLLYKFNDWLKYYESAVNLPQRIRR